MSLPLLVIILSLFAICSDDVDSNLWGKYESLSKIGVVISMKMLETWVSWGSAALLMSGVAVIGYRRFRSLPQAQASDIKLLRRMITENKVLVLSKTYCPYCSRTKALLKSLNTEHTVIELDTREDGEALQAAALELTGQRTVPHVFIGGKHIGGNDMTQALHYKGELVPMLQAVGAL